MISLRKKLKEEIKCLSDESEPEADKNMKWNVDNQMNAVHINFVIWYFGAAWNFTKWNFLTKNAAHQISTIECNLIFTFLLFLLNRISAFFLD